MSKLAPMVSDPPRPRAAMVDPPFRVDEKRVGTALKTRQFLRVGGGRPVTMCSLSGAPKKWEKLAHGEEGPIFLSYMEREGDGLLFYFRLTGLRKDVVTAMIVLYHDYGFQLTEADANAIIDANAITHRNYKHDPFRKMVMEELVERAKLKDGGKGPASPQYGRPQGRVIALNQLQRFAIAVKGGNGGRIRYGPKSGGVITQAARRSRTGDTVLTKCDALVALGDKAQDSVIDVSNMDEKTYLGAEKSRRPNNPNGKSTKKISHFFPYISISNNEIGRYIAAMNLFVKEGRATREVADNAIAEISSRMTPFPPVKGTSPAHGPPGSYLYNGPVPGHPHASHRPQSPITTQGTSYPGLGQPNPFGTGVAAYHHH